jgi:hypothetical protein
MIRLDILLKGDKVIPDTLVEGTAGQWGLANDDYGRLFFSSAGGEDPAYLYQQNIHYGQFDFPRSLRSGFYPGLADCNYARRAGWFRPSAIKRQHTYHFTAAAASPYLGVISYLLICGATCLSASLWVG